MSNLIEVDRWENGIYQLETSDPVIGGPDGIDNLQAKQLANRTQFLKRLLEAGQSNLDAHANAVDPHPQYATKADLAQRLAELVGQSPAALDTLKELADALGNDPNFATTITNELAKKAAIDSPVFTGTPKGPTPPQFDNTTKVATTSFVQQAAGNFQARKYVNGSAALAISDTGSWIEAGGAGPSTITLPAPATSNLTFTVTNVTSNGAQVTISTPSAGIYNQGLSAGTFALDVGATVELVSDASNWTVISHYTRSPIAQTPAQFDNSTKLSTTAFTQAALGNFAGFVGLSSVRALTLADLGKQVNYYGAVNGTIPLPPASSVPAGQGYWITNSGNALLTVSPNGSDTLAGVSGTASLPVGINDNVYVASAGTGSQWIVFGGSAQLKYTGSFSALLGGSGYQKLPSGLIIQWGTGTTQSSGSVTLTFPVAFPTTCRSATANNWGGGTVYVGITSFSAASMVVNSGSVGQNFTWIAIGY
ncbi:gp53-like domain-containing protein [Burkholderia ubonensis]|uniref:Putative tail fiber protein gp53-like C-terminal domain-containing protein n=1 Tax=Burkholderia ubonensis TaxID=101571 RepID=A0AAW3NBK3_9BURK|nr:hypothetical protein [Burkholderia ubonensis]KVT57986.1 hypothetical protein WK53_28475 [Burkholderia ubonensis]